MPTTYRARDREDGVDQRQSKPYGRVPRLTTAALWWGVMAGVGALVHGIGEIVQGNVATEGLFVHSWTTGPIAENLGGEPGITLLPNVLASGILTTVAAVALIVASVVLAGRKGGGSVLLGLSAFLLAVGGGVGPPIIGLCAGAAAIAGRRRAARQTARSARHGAIRIAYRWLFGLSVGLGAFLVFGSLFVALVLDMDLSGAFVAAFLASLAVLPATVALGARVPGVATDAAAPGPRTPLTTRQERP